MCIKCSKTWTAFHILWSLIYVGTGAVQIVTGIFFVISLPVFKLGSNILTGSWNVLVGIGGGMLACFSPQTTRRQNMLMYLTLSVISINTINAVISEWFFYMSDDLQKVLENPNLYSLVYYARITTGISAATVIITSFLDSQLTFCSIQSTLNNNNNNNKIKGSHEQVSDIEYIIPRPKTKPIPKSAKNAYNHCSQSWVFDSEVETTRASNAESPYLKLDDIQDSEVSTNSPLSRQHCDNVPNDLITCHEGSVFNDEEITVNPTVQIDEASDENGSINDRKLNYMKSFSRAPSPNVLSESSSQASLVQSSAPPIYEYLERLTEPTTYRSRLNTAVSERDKIMTSPKPCVSPSNLERQSGGEKIHYASLMIELEQQFISRKEKFPLPTSPPSASESLTVSEKTQSSSRQESSRTDPKSSDAEFSKELEAALQLIQDLESPNTADISEPCPSAENRVTIASRGSTLAFVVRRNSDASESEKTLSAVGSLAELTSPIAECVPEANSFRPTSNSSPHGKNTPIVVQCSHSQSTSGYSSPTHISKDGTMAWSGSSSIDSSSDDLGKKLTCSITNTATSAVISILPPTKSNVDFKHKSVTLINVTEDDGEVSTHKTAVLSAPCSHTNTIDASVKRHGYADDASRAKTIDRTDGHANKSNRRNLSRTSFSNSAPSMWNVRSLLKKKKTQVPCLPPDLEGAIIKSESLAYLNDLELLARHERNKEIQRQIEQRIQQQLGQIPTESNC